MFTSKILFVIVFLLGSGQQGRSFSRKDITHLIEEDHEKCFLRMLCTIGGNREPFGSIGDKLLNLLRDEEILRKNWVPYHVVTELNSTVSRRKNSSSSLGIGERLKDLWRSPSKIYEVLKSAANTMAVPPTSKPQLPTEIPYLVQFHKANANRIRVVFHIVGSSRTSETTSGKFQYALSLGVAEGLPKCWEVFPKCKMTLEDFVSIAPAFFPS